MSSSTSLPVPKIGKFRLVSHIATGGMGAVYKAVDEETGQTVALKVLAPELTSNPILVERFKREAKHAARLSHKNLVQLYECGEADGLYYLSMEYIHGIDLSAYIRRKGRLHPEEARLILIQAAKALEHAFEEGITHRDIKPSNFLLANDEGHVRVKMTDFGLARMVNEEDFRVTRAGTTVGTVDYMAPEQARDSSLADIRSDIYSLGCTFYQMLTGEPPFAEGGLGERVYKHMVAEPPDVREINPLVPAGLWTVLRRMLAKHPDDRFQSPRELIQALRSIEQPAGDSRPGPHPPAGPTLESPSSGDQITATPLSPVPLTGPAPPTVRPSPPSVRGRPKRPTTLNDFQTVAEDPPPDSLGITPEQRLAAAGQFAHATEVQRSGGDLNYAFALLTSCCKLDPINVMYRKMLRQVGRELARTKRGGWFGTLSTLPARSRLRAARRSGDHRRALEVGEELLARTPDDVPTQLEMSASATALNLHGLAAWLLEEARLQAPKDLTILRALADLYEAQHRYRNAVATWQEVARLDPTDPLAPSKVKDLAAAETIARGNYDEL